MHSTADEFPKTGQTPEPIMIVDVRNRGRQMVFVSEIGQARSFDHHLPLAIDRYFGSERWVGPAVTSGFPVRSPSGTRRIYVVDGVGRFHPLRERWRQRIENAVYRRVLLWTRARRNPQSDIR